MAKRLRKFIDPFRESRIPYFLVEVLTDGEGEMTDLLCRYANAAAAEALDTDQRELTGKRYTHRFPAGRLADLRPLREVAFSGSAASFSYEAGVGRTFAVTCYQVMYGVAGVILEPSRPAVSELPHLLAEKLPGAVMTLELSRAGLRCLAFADRLGELTGWSRRELLDRAAEDFSALVDREDWPDLLQDLMDAARDGHSVNHSFRLLRKEGPPIWAELRAELDSAQGGVSTFFALADAAAYRRRDEERLESACRQTEVVRRQLEDVFACMPGGVSVFRRESPGEPLILERLNHGLADLLGYSYSEMFRRTAADPLWRVPAADREMLVRRAAKAWAEGLPLRRICRLRGKGGRTVWVVLEASWRERKEGGSLLCVVCLDVSRERRQRDSMLNILAWRDYDFVLAVNARTGLCRVYGKAAVPEEIAYRVVAAQYIRGRAPTRERSRFRQASRLEVVRRQLETQEVFEYVGDLDTDQGPQKKRMRWSWLDREEEILLVTLETL